MAKILGNFHLALLIGIVLLVVAMFGLHREAIGMEGYWAQWLRFLHVFAGILWIGLLYYFNFVQVPSVAAANADKGGPGPAAINKYVAPRALLWFRWGAVVTWLTGAATLEAMNIGIKNAFLLQGHALIIGIGAWLGTIMLFNVWVLIWPNQKKILGIVQATDEQKAKARKIALMASRANAALSIPMIMCMVGQGHGLPF